MMSIAIAKTCGPGRPKDLEKRAAILQAAKQLFTTQGFDGTSMDAIAGLAGVSKLTVYSHYRDKERLFVAAVECVCQEQMPSEIFRADLKGPLRKQLLTIARAFFALVTSEGCGRASHDRRECAAVAEARAAVLGSRPEAHAGGVPIVPARRGQGWQARNYRPASRSVAVLLPAKGRTARTQGIRLW
jgi:AcrR family transcriptional regulator